MTAQIDVVGVGGSVTIRVRKTFAGGGSGAQDLMVLRQPRPGAP